MLFSTEMPKNLLLEMRLNSRVVEFVSKFGQTVESYLLPKKIANYPHMAALKKVNSRNGSRGVPSSSYWEDFCGRERGGVTLLLYSLPGQNLRETSTCSQCQYLNENQEDLRILSPRVEGGLYGGNHCFRDPDVADLWLYSLVIFIVIFVTG